MWEISLQEIGGKVFAPVAFFSVFIFVFFALWFLIARALETLSVRSRTPILNTIGKELNTPVMLAIVLLSFYFGLAATDASLLEHPLFKIWSVLAVLVVFNIAARVIISFAEHYVSKSTRGGTFRGMLFIFKTGINVLLYALAVIFIVDILNPQLGLVVGLFGLLIMTFVFLLLRDQMSSIVAGTLIAERYLKKGDYIRTCGVEGYVWEIRGRTTLVSGMDGIIRRIPNSAIMSSGITNYSSPGGGNFRILEFSIEGTDAELARKKIFFPFEKELKKHQEVLSEFFPSVVFLGVLEGRMEFRLRYVVSPFADFLKIEETLKADAIGRAKKSGMRILELH